MNDRKQTYRPCVEKLEDRSLLAANFTASLSAGGLLRVTGSDASDTIVVRQVHNRISVNGVAIAKPNGQKVATVAAGAVKSILVNARGGNDKVRLNSEAVAGQQPLAAVVGVVGGNGNNTIFTSWCID